MTRGRLELSWNWYPINRPYVLLCDPEEDDSILVCLQYGNTNSDPVFSIGWYFRGLTARPFVAWANRRWDRQVARQNARKSARFDLEDSA